MNTYIDGSWGNEEMLVYENQQEMNFEVTATKKGFLILLNDEYLHFYKARIPWDTFTGIEVRDKSG
jgi:hypothetical protein